MSDGRTRVLPGLTEEERSAWIAEWREHSDPADIKGFAEAQKILFVEAEQLTAAGLAPASPEAQTLARRWMILLQQHAMISSVTRVHRANPALALKVVANAKKLRGPGSQQPNGVIPPAARFLGEARRIRMEQSGLEELHLEVRRLIESRSSPASAKARRVAERYLEFCEAQFVDDAVSFAQLLSQYLDPGRADAEGRRGQWEFIAKAVHARGQLLGKKGDRSVRRRPEG